MRLGSADIDLRMCRTGVLVDLAEEVLTVDEMKWSAPQITEVNGAVAEVDLGGVRHCADDADRIESSGVGEALLDTS